VLERLALIACVLAAALAAGCGGDDGGATSTSSASGPLVGSSFKEVVLTELKKAGLDAEPGYDLNVVAYDGPDRVDVPLTDPFAEYEADNDRKDEIVAGLVEDAQQRLEAGISNLSLEDVSDDLMPLLKGNFALRTFGFEPAETAFPGNLGVVYVVDAADSQTIVRPEDLERWGTTVEEVHELALDNLLEQTNEEEQLVCEPSGDHELCGWSSSDGYDATRMIVPELRRQIVREYGGPAVFASPMENVFVALPLEILKRGDNEELLRTKLQRDFQTSDFPLSPELFVERDGELVLFE